MRVDDSIRFKMVLYLKVLFSKSSYIVFMTNYVHPAVYKMYVVFDNINITRTVCCKITSILFI